MRRSLKGRTVVEATGSSPSRTSVTRTVYSADGDVIRTETWNTSYEGETRIVRVGTKVKEQKPPSKVPPTDGEKPPDGKAPTPPPSPLPAQP